MALATDRRTEDLRRHEQKKRELLLGEQRRQEAHRATIEKEADRILALMDAERANPPSPPDVTDRLERLEKQIHTPSSIADVRAQYLPDGECIRRDEVRVAIVRKRERRREAAEEAAGLPALLREHEEHCAAIQRLLAERLEAARRAEQDAHAERRRELDELGPAPTLESVGVNR